jgi:putative flippase GtrA
MSFANRIQDISNRNLKPFLTFSTGAATAFVLNIGLLYLAVEWAGLHYLAAYVGVQCLTIVYGFLFIHRFVFTDSEARRSMLFRYIVALLAITVANTLTVRLFTEAIGIYYLVSAIVSTCLYLIVKFVVYRRFVFV